MKWKIDVGGLKDFSKNLRNDALLHQYWKNAVGELADALIKAIKNRTPEVTGELKSGWDGSGQARYTIRANNNGYSVTLYNRVPYASAVNDGHMSYNQYGGPYQIHDNVSIGPFGKLQGRVKVPTPDKRQLNASKWFVFGHFFVEKGIADVEGNNDLLDDIIGGELQKWWDEL